MDIKDSKVQKSSAKKIPPNAGKGRKAGTPNKATKAFRETITKLLEDNSDNVSIWLASVADQDPAKALDLITKLAEYAAPKLSRVEQSGEVAVTNGYHFTIHRAGSAEDKQHNPVTN